MKNRKSFEVPFEVQVLNSNTTATSMRIFRNAATVWHKVRQYMHAGRKCKCRTTEQSLKESYSHLKSKLSKANYCSTHSQL